MNKKKQLLKNNIMKNLTTENLRVGSIVSVLSDIFEIKNGFGTKVGEEWKDREVSRVNDKNVWFKGCSRYISKSAINGNMSHYKPMKIKSI